MKECEWCGDDFRGEGVRLGDHCFCSDGCREDYRKDVIGDEKPEEAEAGEPRSESEVG
ncbi:MAG: hypothetical protein ABIH26_06705 [Candidatus Eisenbacteria bacterium]